MNILFYILVPVYRVERYIDACIKSVTSQEYKNWRLVLVDDGSPDKSGEICDAYAEGIEKIHVIHQKNMGQIAARQTAIRYVRQQSDLDMKQTYILYLDSDDAFKPGALRTIRDSVIRTGCDLLFFRMDRVCDGKVLSSYQPADEFIGEVTDKRKLYNLVFNSAAYNPLCRKAIQLSLYEEIDYSEYYHIRYAEDLLQSLPFYRNCHKAMFIEDSLYNYTVNPTSITQSVCYDNFKVDSTVRAKVLEFIDEENVFSTADMRKYLEYCEDILLGMIATISSFQVTFKKKKMLLDQINKDLYFSVVLSEARVKKLPLLMVRKKRYHLALGTYKIYWMLGRIKKMLKKIFKGNR